METSKDMRQLILDTCKILNLESEQLSTVFTAINLAYNSGWLDRNKLDTPKDTGKSDTEIALEQGASLDDMPSK